MDILRAASDPKVFGSAFKKRKTWEPWFSFLAALFALPMPPTQLALYQECTQRKRPPVTRAVEAWLVCGRRSGKSFFLALIAVFLATFFDWRKHLGVGERGTIMIIAADRKQARVIMRYVKGLLRAVSMLAMTIEVERVESIDLANRVTIEIHTSSFRTVRGYSIVAALLDELAFWPTEDSSSPDFEVINAMRPAMATIPNSMLLCASSPYARKGALWEAYHRYYGKESGLPILVWQAATRTMNPTVSQAFLDAEFEKDPVMAEAECSAQFRTDIESFVSREAVESCVSWGTHELGALDALRYFGFVDSAEEAPTHSPWLIAHREGDIGVLDALREVRPPLSPEGVTGEFAELLKSYGITRVTGDRYGGQFPVEQFRKNRIKYEPSVHPKAAI